jgi:hypothetical protein
MWDTVESPTTQHLTHDMPCPHCGHATHTYLPCSDTCECVLPWLTTRPAPTTAAAAHRIVVETAKTKAQRGTLS